jgi:hypothetical protein
MNINKKLFITLGLVLLLTATLVAISPVNRVFAADTRAVRFAEVVKVQVLDDQPATFRISGSYTCDSVQLNSSVSGKTISIYVYDVKVKYSGRGCDTSTSFRKNINVGTLVPGVYTILINPDVNGKGQKVLKGFIAPMMSTPTPVQ